MHTGRAHLPRRARAFRAFAIGAIAFGCSEIDRTRWKARFGDADAQIALAAAYAEGNAVEQSTAEAAVWYRKAPEQMRPDAAGALARLYAAGEGVPADPDEALKWFESEAEVGGAEVQRALAERLDKGEGVAIDPTRSFK